MTATSSLAHHSLGIPSSLRSSGHATPNHGSRSNTPMRVKRVQQAQLDTSSAPLVADADARDEGHSVRRSSSAQALESASTNHLVGSSCRRRRLSVTTFGEGEGPALRDATATILGDVLARRNFPGSALQEPTSLSDLPEHSSILALQMRLGEYAVLGPDATVALAHSQLADPAVQCVVVAVPGTTHVLSREEVERLARCSPRPDTDTLGSYLAGCPPPPALYPHGGLGTAAGVLLEAGNNAKFLVVVEDPGGGFLGLVSRTDLARALLGDRSCVYDNNHSHNRHDVNNQNNCTDVNNYYQKVHSSGSSGGANATLVAAPAAAAAAALRSRPSSQSSFGATTTAVATAIATAAAAPAEAGDGSSGAVLPGSTGAPEGANSGSTSSSIHHRPHSHHHLSHLAPQAIIGSVGLLSNKSSSSSSAGVAGAATRVPVLPSPVSSQQTPSASPRQFRTSPSSGIRQVEQLLPQLPMLPLALPLPLLLQPSAAAGAAAAAAGNNEQLAGSNPNSSAHSGGSGLEHSSAAPEGLRSLADPIKSGWDVLDNMDDAMDVLGLVGKSVNAEAVGRKLLGDVMGAAANIAGGSSGTGWIFKYLYDGDCSICRTFQAMLEKMDNGMGRVMFVDISSQGFNAIEHGGINYKAAMETIHILSANGQVFKGVTAVIKLLAAVDPEIAANLGFVTAALPLLSLSYLLVSKNRNHLSKVWAQLLQLTKADRAVFGRDIMADPPSQPPPPPPGREPQQLMLQQQQQQQPSLERRLRFGSAPTGMAGSGVGDAVSRFGKWATEVTRGSGGGSGGGGGGREGEVVGEVARRSLRSHQLQTQPST